MILFEIDLSEAASAQYSLSIGTEAPVILGARFDELSDSLRNEMERPFRGFVSDVAPDLAIHGHRFLERIASIEGLSLNFWSRGRFSTSFNHDLGMVCVQYTTKSTGL